MSGDDPTADLILMAKRFEKKCQNSRKQAKKTTLHNKNLAKIPLSLAP
jgi:hypothetical protein